MMSPLRDRLRTRILGVGSGPLRDRYLDLLEAAVTHTLYDPPDARELPADVQDVVREELSRTGERLILRTPHEERAQGRDRPVYAQTMIGLERLRNLRACVRSVIADRVPGDLIEAGCWRGGAAIMMRGVLAAHDVRDRTVWVADSFRGLPEPNAEKFPADAPDLNYTAEELAIPLEEVRANFSRYRLLDDQVRFVEGWFRDTLPTLHDRTWALIRLDGDLYESTLDGLENLYPRLSVGGYLIVDDYGYSNCREAIEDYRRDNGISEEIVPIDWTGAYWRRAR